MNIDGPTLESEYHSAITEWPFIHDVETSYGLAPYTLAAVGSRETNLRNVVGDGGHGYGVWQLDDRSHTIPGGFDTDVHTQAVTAAGMLKALVNEFHAYHDPYLAAFVAYNAGASTAQYNIAHGLPIDAGTAGNDYGTDVRARLAYLSSTEGDEMTPEQAASLANIERLLARIDFGITPNPGSTGQEFSVRGEVTERLREIDTKLATS